MTTTEALALRRSIGAFLPTAVEQDKLTAIFEAAVHTPSWANSQPWEIFVATGKTLERIKKGYGDNYANGVSSVPETPCPVAWSEEAEKRREQLHPNIIRRELKIPDNLKITIGIAIGYPDVQNGINNFKSARVPVEENVRFFD